MSMKRFMLLTISVVLISISAFAQRSTAELVTPPETANVETWYTVDGALYVNSPTGTQSRQPSIHVAIDGTDIYLQGLAYWFDEGWIKGTISGTTATFANASW